MTPSLPPVYTKGAATVALTGGAVRTLKLNLEDGQFDPGGGTSSYCQDGASASYRDTSAGWMLDLTLPDNGVVTPSAPSVMVFLVHPEGTNATGVEASDCSAALTSMDATRLSGTITSKGVSWTDIGSDAQPSPSGAPFEMTITFTATM
jgi:hypothetical protein